MGARVLEHALATLRLARRVQAWSPGEESVLSPAPLMSRLCGRRVFYFRGWRAFDGCVKGYNALGLLADSLARDPSALARPIVCSTSANLGICLHQALALMRRAGVIGPGEGRLVIWCPDARADFMSSEKSATLEAIAAGSGGLTTLRTYINRRQRDPLALREALRSGGHFYPTNPQSRGELERLYAEASDGLGPSKAVEEPLDAGMLGMAAPYVLLLEEILARGGERGVNVWNPASIGAALSALVLADEALRAGSLPEGLQAFAPRVMKAGGLAGIETRVHGVFDIANLQSLAQLFGVVTTRHFSGRQSAYVGLGSSSYANGNLCFEALKASADRGGPFRGRDHLHPATHTLNPVAQALVFADERRKPEPAGAAAVAGYLLARLDGGTLTAPEIAGALRAGGFDAESFLEFARTSADVWLRESADEGPPMASFAIELLQGLDGKGDVGKRTAAPPARPLDAFEELRPALCLNLTGDNTAQPSVELAARLLGKAASSR